MRSCARKTFEAVRSLAMNLRSGPESKSHLKFPGCPGTIFPGTTQKAQIVEFLSIIKDLFFTTTNIFLMYPHKCCKLLQRKEEEFIYICG